MVVARHAQSSKNSKNLCNISKKRGEMKLIFYIQINIKLCFKLIPLTLVGMARPPQITQNNKLSQYLKKEVRDEFFCRWASQFSINWYYHFWWVWPSTLKVLKTISMNCLCNISRKNWVMKLTFCMLIYMKVFYKLIVLFLMGLARHTQSTWVNLQFVTS